VPQTTVSYKAIDPEPHVKRINSQVTIRKDHIEVLEAEIKRAAVGQYDIPVERSTFGGKFPLAPREEKVEPDMRRAINPNIDAIKKVAPAVVIVPEHRIPDSLI